MKCINCGRYPFCEKIEKPQQEACENFIKKLLSSSIKGDEEKNVKSKRRYRS